MAYIILTDEMGARLENEILVRGWSLRDFAKKSGVSVSAISRYINGEVKKVNARTIYKFATTLGTTVDWLRCGAQQNRKNDLISREALINVILNDRKLDGANANWEVNRILVHIDNASTVETFTKDDMEGAYNEGYACGSRESERQKGKIVKDYIPYADDNGDLRTFERYICSECKCGISSMSNFCPNCGADMRGEQK